MALPGWAWHCWDGDGTARMEMALPGWALPGWARHWQDGHGSAGMGTALPGWALPGGARHCQDGHGTARMGTAPLGMAQLGLLPRAALTARARVVPPEKTVTREVHMGPSQGGRELFCCTGEANLRITVK